MLVEVKYLIVLRYLNIAKILLRPIKDYYVNDILLWKFKITLGRGSINDPILSRTISTMPEARILAICVLPLDAIWRLVRDKLPEAEKELKNDPKIFVIPSARNS